MLVKAVLIYQVLSFIIPLHLSLCLQEIRTEEGISAEQEQNASGTDARNEVIGSDVWGEEEGDGARGSSSEPDGEMELEPVASESEDGYSLRMASSSLKLHMTADSVPSSPASSQL